jgi:hypothetical protein
LTDPAFFEYVSVQLFVEDLEQLPLFFGEEEVRISRRGDRAWAFLDERIW